MFEQNNVGVRMQNPIAQYLLSPQRGATTLPSEIFDPTIDHLLAATQRIVSVIEGEMASDL
jgi:hypothetical protein